MGVGAFLLTSLLLTYVVVAVVIVGYPVLAQALTRGERNNNPGNIEKNKINNWRGEDRVTCTDRRFVCFDDIESGVRAMSRILLSYARLHRINTLWGVAHRWAPPNENDTKRYAELLASLTGIGVYEKIDLEHEPTRWEIVKAIAKLESRVELDEGLRESMGN